MKTPTLFSFIIAHLKIFSSKLKNDTSGREQTVLKWDPYFRRHKYDIVLHHIVYCSDV